jgi:hypothetical protein
MAGVDREQLLKVRGRLEGGDGYRVDTVRLVECGSRYAEDGNTGGTRANGRHRLWSEQMEQVKHDLRILDQSRRRRERLWVRRWS